MPASQFTITSNTVRTEAKNSAALEAGILRALTAFTFESNVEAPQIYGEIGIATGPNNLEHRVAVLAQGYFGQTASLFWSGAIPMEPGLLIYCRIWPSATTQVRVAFLTSPL